MNEIMILFAVARIELDDRKKEFERLVNANMKRAYYSALGILGNHDDAMEISQEAFIRAYKHFYKFDPTKKFFTWYYKILRNLRLNRIRDAKNRKETELLEAVAKTENETPDVQLEKEELKERIESALMKLKANDREIIMLKEFENYSYKEISEMLEIPVGSVMSRLFYARKKLAALLKEEEI